LEATTALMLAAAAAAMITVSVVDLGINIARDLGLRQTLLLSASGALTVVLAKNLCISLLSHTNRQAGKAAAAAAAETEAEAEAEEAKGKLRLVRVGLVTAVSLTAHNMPEGMAVAFSTMDSESLGLKLAIAIALHNIPEGLAIGAPFTYFTRTKVQILTQKTLR
jgi:ZIP family zinc transporter